MEMLSQNVMEYYVMTLLAAYKTMQQQTLITSTTMKLTALYVLAVCAAAGNAQSVTVSTTTSFDPSVVSSRSSEVASSLSSLLSSLSSVQSSLTDSVRSSVSSVASGASSAAQPSLNPTPTAGASVEMAAVGGGAVFMGIVAGILAVVV